MSIDRNEPAQKSTREENSKFAPPAQADQKKKPWLGNSEVECWSEKPEVAGPNPAQATNFQPAKIAQPGRAAPRHGDGPQFKSESLHQKPSWTGGRVV